MAHSPSGLQATAPSIGDKAFTDAVAEDGGDSKLSALLFDVSQQVQGDLQSMLKMSSEITRCDGEIDAEVERARDAVAEKGRALHDERERVQKPPSPRSTSSAAAVAPSEGIGYVQYRHERPAPHVR